MIKSKIFIGIIVVECFMLISVYMRELIVQDSVTMPLLQEKKMVVTRLGLTDLAIWTEARYTRHPSQADFFSAFQDFPASFDHFPAGSIIAPVQYTTGDNQ